MVPRGPDGERFFILKDADEGSVTPLTLVSGWDEELESRWSTALIAPTTDYSLFTAYLPAGVYQMGEVYARSCVVNGISDGRLKL